MSSHWKGLGATDLGSAELVKAPIGQSPLLLLSLSAPSQVIRQQANPPQRPANHRGSGYS